MRAARDLFRRYDGSRFYMSRAGVESEYLSFEIPPELEQAWLAELTAEELDSLGAVGNWRVINFLHQHGLVEHVDSALTATPLGALWERTSYLEMLWQLVNHPLRSVDSEARDRVADYVRAHARQLQTSARSDKSRTRIDQLLAKLGEVE